MLISHVAHSELVVLHHWKLVTLTTGLLLDAEEHLKQQTIARSEFHLSVVSTETCATQGLF